MIILYMILLYLMLGVAFAVYFVTIAINSVDPSAKGTSWGFKIIILPGCILLWPVILKKYLKSKN